MNIFDNSKKFICRNARPLELALWKFHFENGSKESVIEALQAYQNEDGGFGHGLEPDNFTPFSTPITTNHAVKILDEIDFNDRTHPVVQGIFRYLSSGNGFADGKWCFAVPENNGYPHAVWWECGSDKGEPSDNPTVSLAGFVLKFGDRNSELYKKCLTVANRCAAEFMKSGCNDMHVLSCYCYLLSFVYDLSIDGLFNKEVLKKKLISDVNNTICKDTARWETDYVCMPSNFFDRSKIVFNTIDSSLKIAEAEMITKTQLPDGSFNITWQWHNDYKEFEVSKNFWKSIVTLKNTLYCLELYR